MGTTGGWYAVCCRCEWKAPPTPPLALITAVEMALMEPMLRLACISDGATIRMLCRLSCGTQRAGHGRASGRAHAVRVSSAKRSILRNALCIVPLSTLLSETHNHRPHAHGVAGACARRGGGAGGEECESVGAQTSKEALAFIDGD